MDVVATLSEYGVEGVLTGNEYMVLCPFHTDSSPSCSVNIDKGVFKCFSCDAKGDVYAFLAGVAGVPKGTIKRHLTGGSPTKKAISEQRLLKWNAALVSDPSLLALIKKKGIGVNDIEQHLMGHDGQRFTIPIYDSLGKVINVRRYQPDLKKNKWLNIKGCGGTHLYPIEMLQKEKLIITEGEMKALLLNQIGLPAICQSGGAGSWSADLNIKFKDKDIYIIYDIDKAGTQGAERIAVSLYKFARQVKVIALPMDPRQFPKGDITNFIVDLEKTKDDVLILMRDAPIWEPTLNEIQLDDEVFPTHLSKATEARYCNKIISTKVVVTAKDTVPYIIPKKFKVDCTKDRDYCAFCNVYNYESEYELNTTDPVILDLVGVSTAKLGVGLKRIAGIPASCNVCRFETLQSINVEEIRIMPRLEITTEATEHVVRQGYYIGHGIETNTTYDIRARMCPRPDTQYATLIIFDADTVIDDLATFKLKDLNSLKVFQPKQWTMESLREKIKDIYDDLASNVTRIYMRQDLHLFYDLIYHSALYIPFQGQVIKGWAEGLVLGDSGQGKSEAVSKLQKHYELGEKIDVKSATAAGLVGGLQETSKRWFVTWGILPLNDKRLVVLEEVKGLHPEIIAKLTEVRSSGIAEVSKVEKARTNSRTRLIWISNPRSDRQVLAYNYGVECIKELIGNLEDIRRFDMSIVLSSGDVDRKWVNISDKDRPHHVQFCTGDKCQELILWGWSRTPDDILMDEDTVANILFYASKMGKDYSSTIPLVEAADQRLKIARLATALAIRTYSTEDGVNVIVRKCHVKYVYEFLDGLYKKPCCGYRDYSEMIFHENTVHDADEIIEKIKALPYAKDTVRALLDSEYISAFDICDWTEMDIDRCRSLIGVLVRKNAIKRKKRNYVKAPSFIALLKKLQLEEKLSNETAYEQTSSEDF